MKAVALLPQRRAVGFVDEPTPSLSGPTQVKLHMLEVGVCGTDREIAAFEYGTPPPSSDHLVMGHESLGEVVEAGPEVTRVKPGDLVVPTVRRPCQEETCRPCRAGRSDFCSSGRYVERGIKEAHGFLAEYVVEDERYLNLVPPELRPVGVLVEPLTVTEKALIQLRHLQGRLPWACPHAATLGFGHCHRAVVIGAGPVGLLATFALLNSGFETWVYSRDPVDGRKADLVRSIGGRYVSSATDGVDKLSERVGSVDLVYEAAGAAKIAFDVLRVLGTNGVFVFTGVPGKPERLELEAAALMKSLVLRNQVVLGTVNAGRDAFEAAVRDLGVFVGRWPEAVGGLITGRFPLEDHRRLLTERVPGIKNVIVVAGSA